MAAYTAKWGGSYVRAKRPTLTMTEIRSDQPRFVGTHTHTHACSVHMTQVHTHACSVHMTHIHTHTCSVHMTRVHPTLTLFSSVFMTPVIFAVAKYSN